MPLLNYTRGRILWSLEKYEQSIEKWDVVLNMTIEEVAGKWLWCQMGKVCHQ